jgi:predicted RNA-binding protein Jag
MLVGFLNLEKMKATLRKTKTNYILSIDEKSINLFNYAIDSKDYGWVVADILGGELLKLSKENCDEIFGLPNFEKIKENFINDQLKGLSEEDRNQYLEFARSEAETYILGVKFGLGLNKNKTFTLENMNKAFELGKDVEREDCNDNFQEYLQSLQQPTEIEVDIVMECKTSCVNFIFNGENSLCCGDKVPRLDSNNCLILKPIK